MTPSRALQALVVDDDPLMRQLLAETLRSEGLEVREAANGFEALAAVQQNAPDLIFMDIVMPEKDGIETIRELRKQGNAAWIVAISGHTRVGDRLLLEAARAFGANDALAKPFQTAAVAKIARERLARAQR